MKFNYEDNIDREGTKGAKEAIKDQMERIESIAGPDDLKELLQKIERGEVLNDADRELLAEWRELLEQRPH